MKKWLIGGSLALVLLVAAVLIPQSLAQAAAQPDNGQKAVLSDPWSGVWGPEDCPMRGGGYGTRFGRGLGAGYGALDSVTLTRIAQLLGLTPLQVQVQLAEGKSLAQIAQSKNVTTEQLVTTILAPYKEHLQIDVKYGYLTQTEADQITIQAQARALNQINFVRPVTPGAGVSPRARGQWGTGPGSGRGGMMGTGPGIGKGGMMGGGMMGGRGWR